MVQLGRVFELSPWRIAGGYAAFGIAWILVSDRLVYAVFGADSTSLLVQTAKGLLFVGVSAAMIFGLTRAYEAQLAETKGRAISLSEQLQVLHRIFRHDVRNDLTVIYGFAELLRAERRTDQFEAWTQEILETARDLIGMAEKLRIVNEVDIASTAEEPIDVVPIIEHEIEHFRDRYPEATFRTDLPDRLDVFADPSFQYAIHEGLENAMVHHTAPEGERHVEIAADETVSEVTVEITDDGPGIPPEEVAPVESGSEGPLSHGSGVGLWIISWLCRSFDGSVGFDGGDGTTVRMRLEQAEPIEHVTDRLQYEIPTAPGQ
jgi:signal transduction histidine kinase